MFPLYFVLFFPPPAPFQLIYGSNVQRGKEYVCHHHHHHGKKRLSVQQYFLTLYVDIVSQ